MGAESDCERGCASTSNSTMCMIAMITVVGLRFAEKAVSFWRGDLNSQHS